MRESHSSSLRQPLSSGIHSQRAWHQVTQTLAQSFKPCFYGTNGRSSSGQSICRALQTSRLMPSHGESRWKNGLSYWRSHRHCSEGWGQPQVDLFADGAKVVVPVFFSVKTSMATPWAGTHFTSRISNEHIAFPPPQLISQTVGKIIEVQDVMILTTSLWQEVSW